MTAAYRMPDGSTSASLLKRLRGPASSVAWDRFVQVYTPLLFYWARKAGPAEADASDLVQDVFCILIRKLPSHRSRGRKSLQSQAARRSRNAASDRR